MKKLFFLFLLIPLLSGCHEGSGTPEEYLSFLYSYMPLPDSVDYSRAFWEQNVSVSMQARREMPWGNSVPEREWRHFVLPVRVNNENLDTSRVVFYRELKERVSHLSMHDAALEVNHWCHEYVTYQPSDGRTSAPLATMRSSIGRCGEESTFCVAALRAVCIPARQVYTPRWAHTDDNHAWVEVWVDGAWHFMGACEPEAVLDKGWFNQPASRGMLMHTKVFGSYDGPEEVVSQNACYTEINVTANYAPVSTLQVQVIDSTGCPVEAAFVDFRLYNYGEFYRLTTKTTDAQGCASLTCGRGDLFVWARHDGLLGFSKASVGTDSLVQISLCDVSALPQTYDLDLTPPSEHDNMPSITPEQEEANKQRLAYEDSLRTSRPLPSFPKGHPFASLFRRARANAATLLQFVDEVSDTALARALLTSISAKDLRDVTLDVLHNHYDNAIQGNGSVWQRYLLSPRISNELLTPWRDSLSSFFANYQPSDIIRWVNDSLTIDDTRNPLHYCMSPLGVLRHRTTDPHSRDIFLVAAMRSAGIPARIDEVTGKVQWIEPGSPKSSFSEYSDGAEVVSPKGRLELLSNPPYPHYYTHFTLSRIHDDGSLQLLENEREDVNYKFQPGGISYDAGRYLLVTGQRLANGGVLARLTFFSIPEDGEVQVPLVVRHETDQVQVIGSFDSESLYLPLGDTSQRSLLSTTGRGYYVVGFIAPGQEPTNHALRDLTAARTELAAWGRPIILLAPEGVELSSYLSRPEFQGLPSTVSFGTDVRGLFASSLSGLRSLYGSQTAADYPVFLIADTFNRVVFCSCGYTIGLGTQLSNITSKL